MGIGGGASLADIRDGGREIEVLPPAGVIGRDAGTRNCCVGGGRFCDLVSGDGIPGRDGRLFSLCREEAVVDALNSDVDVSGGGAAAASCGVRRPIIIQLVSAPPGLCGMAETVRSGEALSGGSVWGFAFAEALLNRVETPLATRWNAPDV